MSMDKSVPSGVLSVRRLTSLMVIAAAASWGGAEKVPYRNII
jgi:hypothetical protein